jgi:hypothetical protein
VNPDSDIFEDASVMPISEGYQDKTLLLRGDRLSSSLSSQHLGLLTQSYSMKLFANDND